MNDASTHHGKQDEAVTDSNDNTTADAAPEETTQPQADANGGGAKGATGTPSGGGGDRGGDRRAAVLAAVALLIALIVAGLGGMGGWWVWERFQALERASDDYAERMEVAEVRERFDSLEGNLTGRVDNLAQEHSSHVQSLARAEETMRTVRDQHDGAQERMDRIEELAAAHRDEWILSEAGYLYGVARYRARFHGDVNGALQALREADSLLEELGGATVDQRQAVADAINALLDVRLPDREAMAADLRALINGVDEWSLKRVERRVEPAEAPRQRDAQLDSLAGWRDAGLRAWEQFRDAIGSLVVVRRDDAPPRLMAPEESHYLRENLRLQLLSARAALLQGDAATYRDSLDDVGVWLDRHFDAEDEAVSDARETVSRLRDTDVEADMPDLGEKLPERRLPGRNNMEDGE
ncbi:uroporphyrinogen-III C-methyltransferase [Aquisalimonas sp.]|uniref:uroporphyrinogen-III C-methyltransferase n=1 Tax=unclassified Aquisalimonas TaxID=2644645 RepID=UPI0025BD4907|nr:uroporphyrinogen-III C-methyltransferase [Aquisalimonas sp.]